MPKRLPVAIFLLICALCPLAFSLGGCASPGGSLASRLEGQLKLAPGANRDGAPVGPVVIYLESDLPLPTPAAPVPARVRHDGVGFRPGLAVVGRGALVEIANDSSVHHRLFWISGAQRHSLSVGPGPGALAELELTEPGVARVYCELHPEEHFTAFVAPSHLYSVLEAPGHFEIDAVPPGAWRLHLWSERFQGKVREIEVSAYETLFEELRIGDKYTP